MKHLNLVINQKPSQAAAKKGYAHFPEDFERLSAGENFVLWREGDIMKAETTLSAEDFWLTLDARLQTSKSEDRKEC